MLNNYHTEYRELVGTNVKVLELKFDIGRNNTSFDDIRKIYDWLHSNYGEMAPEGFSYTDSPQYLVEMYLDEPQPEPTTIVLDFKDMRFEEPIQTYIEHRIAKDRALKTLIDEKLGNNLVFRHPRKLDFNTSKFDIKVILKSAEVLPYPNYEFPRFLNRDYSQTAIDELSKKYFRGTARIVVTNDIIPTFKVRYL